MFMLFLLRPLTKWCYCDVMMHALYILSRERVFISSACIVTPQSRHFVWGINKKSINSLLQLWLPCSLQGNNTHIPGYGNFSSTYICNLSTCFAHRGMKKVAPLIEKKSSKILRYGSKERKKKLKQKSWNLSGAKRKETRKEIEE